MEKTQYFESQNQLQGSTNKAQEFRIKGNNSTKMLQNKSKLPKVSSRIPGRTTHDGTFKPFTFSVSNIGS